MAALPRRGARNLSRSNSYFIPKDYYQLVPDVINRAPWAGVTSIDDQMQPGIMGAEGDKTKGRGHKKNRT